LPRNLEIKAGTDDQIDRYYLVDATGRERLKLRRSRIAGAQLVRYTRPEIAGLRASDYEITAVRDAEARACLVPKGKPLVTVRKSREILLIDNVRIHLDTVEGLGKFVELEAVVDASHDEAACREDLRRLMSAFGLGEDDLVRASYSDLLLAVGLPRRILLTGAPGCGKTTLVKSLVRSLEDVRLSGFFTEETRGPQGRTGFRIQSLDGKEGLLEELDAEAKAARIEVTRENREALAEGVSRRLRILVDVSSGPW
jgi:predicted adenylyl cyclase CyaB